MPGSEKKIAIAPLGYDEFLQDLKGRIQQAQVRAALSVNRELIMLYWQIGHQILSRQKHEGWGTKVIDQLAKDLRRSFPEMKGFSPRNLKYMRAFARAHPDKQFVQQVAAQLPWFHNCVILDRVKDKSERQWYISQTIKNSWSRAILELQIENKLCQRQGKAITNFASTLPEPQSDLAQKTLKDPYVFDFLTLNEPTKERSLERALVQKLCDFMLELGSGFAFMGSQYHLEVEGEDFYIDLLFYHHSLRCLVAIELKIDDFKPEYAGKMNFYLSLLDDLVKHSDDQPSVGIILCKGKKKTIGEYALRDISKPIGVSAYKLTESLPKSLKEQLPSIEQLQAQLEDIVDDYEN